MDSYNNWLISTKNDEFWLILKATDFYHKLSIIGRKWLFSNENSMKFFFHKKLSKNFGYIFRVSFVYVHWSSFYESVPFSIFIFDSFRLRVYHDTPIILEQKFNF